MHKKLFTTGPIEVDEKILSLMSHPVISHRERDFEELFDKVTSKLKKLLFTNNFIILGTCPSTGLMEAAIINCVKKRCLNLSCGHYGEKWHDITLRNAKPADILEVEWGKAIKPEMVDKWLSSGHYDSVTLVHNESSTGVINALSEISDVVKKYPDVLLLVDSSSSMMGAKIEVDRLGIDVCISSLHGCFAIPPAFSICSVSEKALKRAQEIKCRGYYFDFLLYFDYYKLNQTPDMPSEPHIFALNAQLDRIIEEGIEKRAQRHLEMSKTIQSWAKEYFDIFAEEGCYSPTVTCIKNTRNVNVSDLNMMLAEHEMAISNGFGPLKNKTFRVGHMGDLTPSDIKELISAINSILGL